MKSEQTLRVAIAGGGTGGHIMPALAIAEGLQVAVAASHRYTDVEFLFFGGSYGLENTLVPEAGYRLEVLPIRGLQRALTLSNLGRNLQLPFRILTSALRTNRLLKEFDPHITVGTGGYASAIPVRQSIARGIPVVLQEQNSYPGLTTRLYADKARCVYLTYADAAHHLPDAKTLITGNPIRQLADRVDRREAAVHFGLEPGTSTLLVFGGSQGAHVLNEHLMQNLQFYLEQLAIQVVWQTGERDLSAATLQFDENPRVKVLPFIRNMQLAYSLADLVICRAGAMTITELCHFGRPSILVPLPSAAANHQEHNARSLSETGAAETILEKDFNRSQVLQHLKAIMTDGERLKQMSQAALEQRTPDATARISKSIIEETAQRV